MTIKTKIGITFSTMLLASVATTVQPQPTASPQPTPNSTLLVQEQEELRRLQEEKRIRELVEESIDNSSQMRDRIQAEVDRAFNNSTTLLNALLVILTLIPILGAIAVWFLQRTIISELATDIEKKVNKKFNELNQ